MDGRSLRGRKTLAVARERRVAEDWSNAPAQDRTPTTVTAATQWQLKRGMIKRAVPQITHFRWQWLMPGRLIWKSLSG